MGRLARLLDPVSAERRSADQPTAEKMPLPGLCNRLVVNRHPRAPTIPERRARTRPSAVSVSPSLRALTRSFDENIHTQRRHTTRAWPTSSDATVGTATPAAASTLPVTPEGRPWRDVFSSRSCSPPPERQGSTADAPCHTFARDVAASGSNVRTFYSAVCHDHLAARPERLPRTSPIHISPCWRRGGALRAATFVSALPPRLGFQHAFTRSRELDPGAEPVIHRSFPRHVKPIRFYNCMEPRTQPRAFRLRRSRVEHARHAANGLPLASSTSWTFSAQGPHDMRHTAAASTSEYGGRFYPNPIGSTHPLSLPRCRSGLERARPADRSDARSLSRDSELGPSSCGFRRSLHHEGRGRPVHRAAPKDDTANLRAASDVGARTPPSLTAPWMRSTCEPHRRIGADGRQWGESPHPSRGAATPFLPHGSPGSDGPRRCAAQRSLAPN